jgi:hypothetical protein
MKKDKQEHFKAARKAIRKDIKVSLVAKLKEVMDYLGQDSKKLEKRIEKASGKLANKLSKELKVGKTGSLEVGNGSETANDAVESKNAVKQNDSSANTLKASAHKNGTKATKRVKQEA